MDNTDHTPADALAVALSDTLYVHIDEERVLFYGVIEGTVFPIDRWEL